MVEFDGSILIGSNEPIEIDPNRWLSRLAGERVRRHLGAAVIARSVPVLRSARPADADRFAGTQVNRDLFPRDEFRTPPGR